MANKGKPGIFLCHAKEDKARVIELYHQLKAAGYHPWLDKYDLLPGQDWWTEIEKIISDPYNLVVVCLSKNSTTKRGVVQQELANALDVLKKMPEDTIYLIPARLEPCQVPKRLSHLHWVDLFEPDGFEKLKQALDFEISHRRATARRESIRQAAQAESGKSLEITPTERLENNCPHISVVVKNRGNKTVFCKAESHSIYNSSGEDIKRSVSSYANHFSWAGGSDRGTKEIPPNLDGIINLAKVNKRGYGIAFLFDENPHSYWKTEGTYKLDLMIAGEFEENSSRMEFVGQRVIVEFAYTKKETQSSSGEVVNNSELRLLTWRLMDID
jgi:hypothetical protein